MRKVSYQCYDFAPTRQLLDIWHSLIEDSLIIRSIHIVIAVCYLKTLESPRDRDMFCSNRRSKGLHLSSM